MAETRTETAPVQAQAKQEKNDSIKVTYRPGPGDPKETEVFGQKVKAGKTIEIPAKHKERALGNPYLKVEGEKSFGDDRKEDEKPEEQEDASFEDNLARERSEEYLSGRPLSMNAPGEAERVIRAQEQAMELREAAKSDDKDTPVQRRRN